jgi:hypothetical protein
MKPGSLVWTCCYVDVAQTLPIHFLSSYGISIAKLLFVSILNGTSKVERGPRKLP